MVESKIRTNLDDHSVGITLITPTGDRDYCLKKCIEYINRQTIQPNQWLFADSGKNQTVYKLIDRVENKNINVEIINNSHLSKTKKAGYNFSGNILALLKRVRYNKVIVIEDDDWYAPNYLEVYSKRLENNLIVGEARAIYYNIYHRKWKRNGNTKHASFCQTAFQARLIPKLKKACEVNRNSAFVDARFWKWAQDTLSEDKISLKKESKLCVGIKGMPGRKGVGIGHRPGGSFTKDNYFDKLRKYIGLEDTNFYVEVSIAMRKKRDLPEI